ncbi:hypothetical protein E2C01_012288 [Portunus trituberculatus]|uniref:Uncharacterized protein n=1 Tax=Portunus trituberculatus TaxID=210409 RepID=A0A5B7DE79_PORTR|nr:hypothetical protein [Portunus trituberculatus]
MPPSLPPKFSASISSPPSPQVLALREAVNDLKTRCASLESCLDAIETTLHNLVIGHASTEATLDSLVESHQTILSTLSSFTQRFDDFAARLGELNGSPPSHVAARVKSSSSSCHSPKRSVQSFAHSLLECMWCDSFDKLAALQAYVLHYHPQVFFIQEAFIGDRDHPDAPSLPGYVSYVHKVRNGLLIYMHSSLPHKLLRCSTDDNTTFQLFKVTRGTGSLHLCNMLPPTWTFSSSFPSSCSLGDGLHGGL